MIWKLVEPLFEFQKFTDHKFVIKVINTQQLVTEPSQSLDFFQILVKIHNLESSPEVVIGYEILEKEPFPLVVLNSTFLLLGTNSLKSCTPKKIYEDKNLKMLKFNKGNFLFLSKEKN